ncbi:hypothetical protein OA064_01880 [Candidatus Pelagibacter sp.]|jgi:hypothetical protein|nr:hypothetical protein [Candidatus Pelagibacter sp.]
MKIKSAHGLGDQTIGTNLENQKLNTFRICGTSLVLISDNFLLFTRLLIFSHSEAHAGQALVDLL